MNLVNLNDKSVFQAEVVLPKREITLNEVKWRSGPSAGQTGNCGSTLEVLLEESSRFDRSSASVTAQDVDSGEVVTVDGAISVTILWVSVDLISVVL
jgi:hypothetical protein